MTNVLFTIGYSNHLLDRFIEFLTCHHISALADVRSIPYSKFNSQFNRENLVEALRKKAIMYVFLGKELGARRDEKECYVNGQVQYNLVAKLDIFQGGLQRIRNGLEKYRVALMCAEKDPLECHRTILVCRNLRQEVFAINHIRENGDLEAHSDAEKRLMNQLNIQPDLFDGPIIVKQLIEKAYDIQSDKIAYREDELH